MTSIRFRIDPRLVPAGKIARLLGLTESDFESKRAALHQRGLPYPCDVTGHYDLRAVETWLDRRAGLSQSGDLGQARNAADVVAARLDAHG